MSKLITTILAALALSTVAYSATPPTDAYQVRYFANVFPDSGNFVNVTNTGTNPGVNGDICVNVYVFDPAEELGACCACPITQNGLASFSVFEDLVSNWLHKGPPTSVTVALVATQPGKPELCDASQPTVGTLASGLRAWATTIHQPNLFIPTFSMTETEFSQIDAPTATWLAHVTSTCGFIQADASSFGICKSCPTPGNGGQGAIKR